MPTKPDSKNDAFPQRLRKLRRERGLSQTEFGNLVGVNYVQIGRYELGKVFPSGPTLRRMAEALDTTTDYLMDGATEKLAANRLNDQKLLRRFQEIEKLPEDRKSFVLEVIDSLLVKQKVDQAVSATS